ncbi:2-C-methyl-D-erythritol 4-phosphate cytidylyltransferase [Piscinibacter sp. XHJ-5]|uniref:2-C-methyl-D-erythritol 4-phosphate cytidylyltransferase n=1 Tax=Piscinibacter sp. XHJ-5 TaxID=3037797 RepID=UPI0024536D90|nr:2-C-methyl-D-erythritol 4-phosphate cytidylyltransferase [Piscinibacter sp. XHJ-5]
MPAQSPRFHALVPCAGTGSRAATAGPKQYADVAGCSVVAHTLAALAGVARIAQVLVVLGPDDVQFEARVPGFRGAVARCGGDTRAQSVANGLAELARRGAWEHDWVLVHDAARCLVRPEWIDALIDACADDQVGGLLALPVPDTLKQERDGRVAGTLDRAHTWQAQTPQMFRLGTLREALVHAGPGVTDEASAIEAMGLAPRLVRGSPENFKLTYPQDFELAERLLRTRS